VHRESCPSLKAVSVTCTPKNGPHVDHDAPPPRCCGIRPYLAPAAVNRKLAGAKTTRDPSSKGARGLRPRRQQGCVQQQAPSSASSSASSSTRVSGASLRVVPKKYRGSRKEQENTLWATHSGQPMAWEKAWGGSCTSKWINTSRSRRGTRSARRFSGGGLLTSLAAQSTAPFPRRIVPRFPPSRLACPPHLFQRPFQVDGAARGYGPLCNKPGLDAGPFQQRFHPFTPIERGLRAQARPRSYATCQSPPRGFATRKNPRPRAGLALPHSC